MLVIGPLIRGPCHDITEHAPSRPPGLPSMRLTLFPPPSPDVSVTGVCLSTALRKRPSSNWRLRSTFPGWLVSSKRYSPKLARAWLPGATAASLLSPPHHVWGSSEQPVRAAGEGGDGDDGPGLHPAIPPGSPQGTVGVGRGRRAISSPALALRGLSPSRPARHAHMADGLGQPTPGALRSPPPLLIAALCFGTHRLRASHPAERTSFS